MSMDTDLPRQTSFNSQTVSNDQGVWRWWLLLNLYFVQRIWWLELEHSWIWLLISSNDVEMFVSVEWVVTWDYNEYWLQLPPHAKSAYHFLSSGRLIGFFFKAWATSHSSYVDTQPCFLNAPYSWTYEQRKQYKFSCCVLCREVVLFSEVQNVLKLASYKETNYSGPWKVSFVERSISYMGCGRKNSVAVMWDAHSLFLC